MSYTLEDAAKVKIPEKLSDQFMYLWERWQDEKEYEDFADYQNVMKSAVEQEGGKFLKMTKRPWYVEFELQGVVKYMQKKGNYLSYGSKIKKSDVLIVRP